VNLFVYASLEDRIQRKLALSSGEKSEAQIKKEIVAADKQREKYYNFYTATRWGDSRNYHLCIDTSLIGVDGAVDLVIEFINKIGSSDIMPN
jgi:cytidylate kinase